MSKETVAILTSFTFIHHGYSLTGIVEDQVRMLVSHGHDVHLFVCENFPDKEEEKLFAHDPWTKVGYSLHKSIPQTNLTDYRDEELSEEHQEVVLKTSEVLLEKLIEIDCDIVFTHDWLLTGWNLPYGLGVLQAGKEGSIRKIAWMHWIHSLPTNKVSWWEIRRWGSRHKLIFPNKANQQLVAEMYGGATSYVIPIPHIKDYRSYWEFSEETHNFIEDFPLIMQGDITMVYPASTDRLGAKRVGEIISIFKEFKNMGFNPCLVIANQWATGRARKEDLAKYYKRIRLAGLKTDKEVIFTSEWRDEFATGIPRRMLRELQLMTSLFIFPTHHESFGLAAPEAALSGVMMVLNRSLPMMWEVQGGCGIFAEFGSFEKELKVPTTEKEYFIALAHLIVGRMQRSEVISSKIFNRRRYNWDNIYNKFYLPTFGESDIW
jgi:hypothetical protein